MHNFNNFITISFQFQSALSTCEMLIRKGECLKQREQIPQKNRSEVYLLVHIFLFVSQKRGSSMLVHCVPKLTCKSVNSLIGQLLPSVYACFSSSKQICIGQQQENTLKYVELRQYLPNRMFNPKQAGGGGGEISPQVGSSLCCAETVSSRKLKLSDFYYIYYILIGLNSEHNPV